MHLGRSAQPQGEWDVPQQGRRDAAEHLPVVQSRGVDPRPIECVIQAEADASDSVEVGIEIPPPEPPARQLVEPVFGDMERSSSNVRWQRGESWHPSSLERAGCCIQGIHRFRSRRAACAPVDAGRTRESAAPNPDAGRSRAPQLPRIPLSLTENADRARPIRIFCKSNGFSNHGGRWSPRRTPPDRVQRRRCAARARARARWHVPGGDRKRGTAPHTEA
jgi:hypothetical protein